MADEALSLGRSNASSGEQQWMFSSRGEEDARQKRPENVRPIREGSKPKPLEHQTPKTRNSGLAIRHQAEASKDDWADWLEVPPQQP